MSNLIDKTRRDYNTIALHFSKTRSSKLWPEVEQFRPFIHDGQRLLDWGCGNGRLLDLFKDNNIQYIGTDISEKLVAVCKKTYADFIKQKRAAFYCTSKKEKIFPADYFDLAFLIASFHHLPTVPSRRKTLKKIFNELKPGGKIILTVWNLGTDWAKAKLRKDYKKIGKNDFLVPWKNPEGKIITERYYHHFGKTELRDLLASVGFMVEPYTRYNAGTWPNAKGGQNLVAVAYKPFTV